MGFSKSFPFKTLMTQHQYQFPLIHMTKNCMVSSQEGNISSISYWCMAHPSLNKQRTHRYQVINFFIGIKIGHSTVYQKIVNKK